MHFRMSYKARMECISKIRYHSISCIWGHLCINSIDFLIKENKQISQQVVVYMKCMKSRNLPERVQILGHAHILSITVRENRIICCQIFCDLLLKSAFERIFNVMQLILVKIKWKYLIKKFHDICLSYYFKSPFKKRATNFNVNPK